MVFRHPIAIREELSRFVKMAHAIDEALQSPELSMQGAEGLEEQKLIMKGIIMALRWSACDKNEILNHEGDQDHGA